MGGHFLTKERENKMGLWDDINEIDWWYTGNHATVQKPLERIKKAPIPL